MLRFAHPLATDGRKGQQHQQTEEHHLLSFTSKEEKGRKECLLFTDYQ